MNEDIKTFARRVLPTRLWHYLQRLYYPWAVRRMSPERWPAAHAVAALLKKGHVVVDVGANVGYISYWLSQWVGPDGEVHSFEPVPRTFALLARNMVKLGAQNVRLYRAAASDHMGEVDLEIPLWNGGRKENLYEARIIGTGDTGRHRVKAPAVMLDRVFEGYPGFLAFMKIDVEGHEAHVLHGARQVIEKWKPALAVEVSAPTAGAVFAELSARAYEAFEPVGQDLRLVREPKALADALFLQPHHGTTLRGCGIRIRY